MRGWGGDGEDLLVAGRGWEEIVSPRHSLLSSHLRLLTRSASSGRSLIPR